MLKVGDLVTVGYDLEDGLAIILKLGNIWCDDVLIQFIESGAKHTTFK